MQKAEHRRRTMLVLCALFAGACAGARATQPSRLSAGGPVALANANPARSDARCPAEPIPVSAVRRLVDAYCVSCHSPRGAAGEDYDFTSDDSINARRRNIEAKLRLHIMPPPNARQPSEADRWTLRCWAKS